MIRWIFFTNGQVASITSTSIPASCCSIIVCVTPCDRITTHSPGRASSGAAISHAERREALDHMPVMYDRAKGRHTLALPDGFLDQRDRPVNPEAEARCFRQYDLHSCHRPSCKSF